MAYSILFIIQFLAVLASGVVTFIIVVQKTTTNQEILALTSIATTVELLGYLSEMLCKSSEAAFMSKKIEVMGLLFINTLLLIYVSRCCDFKLKLWHRTLFIIVDAIFIFLGFTSDHNELFFKSAEFVETGLYPHLIVHYGPLYVLCGVYNISIIVFQIVIIAIYIRNNYNNRVRSNVLVALEFAYLFPILGFAYYLTPFWRKYIYEPFFIFVFFGFVYFLFIIYRYNLFDVLSFAKDDVLKNINEGFLIIDTKRNLLFANEKIKTIYPEIENRSQQLSIINNIYRNNKKDLNLDGRIYTVSVLPFNERNTLMGYRMWLFDKTEERQKEAQILEAKDQAEKANQAKTMFLANMSHEIRTPMNAILGTTEIILNESISPQVEENVLSIKNAGMTLISIINDVLDFSKIEAGKMKPNDIEYSPGMMIKEVTDAARMRLEQKGVAFRLHVKETLPSKMRGDETHVRQVYTNILNNAVKYTKSGYVTMNVDWEQVSGIARIRVSVEDTGIGIKEEELPNIFNSFERADMIKNKTIEGTGLGLAIAKRLVESMGGKINVRSTYGEGSNFSFTYFQSITDYTPLGNIEDLHYENSEKNGDSFIAPMARILVVDDNITNIKVIQGILNMYQIRVDVALGGSEAIEKAARNHYHMILMDQMMPVIDGIEAAKRIRELPGYDVAKTPIIALTANAIRGAREMFISEGFQDYISKPLDIKILERILKSFLPGDFIRYVDKKETASFNADTIIIPNVDVDKGIENYGNSRARYVQVLKYIYTDGEQQLSRMEEQINTTQYDNFVFEVHAIKGLAYGIGAQSLGDNAYKCEMAAREKRIDELLADKDSFFKEYREILSSIKKVLEQNEIAIVDTVSVTGGELSNEEFDMELLAILASADVLEQQEIEKRLVKVLSNKMDDDTRKKLEQARNSNLEFEYEQVITIINGILNDKK